MGRGWGGREKRIEEKSKEKTEETMSNRERWKESG